jgi:hypothetical protein
MRGACWSSSSSPLQTSTDPLTPSPRRSPRRAVRPAGRVPVPPIVDGGLALISGPHHDVGDARPDLVITPRTAIGLRRAGPGHRSYVVVVAIGAGLYPGRRRQRGRRTLLAGWGSAPGHATSLAVRTAGTRCCPCRASDRNPMSHNVFHDQRQVFALAA